jgi:TRAP-type C4-dicarboxylate transport system substrate-binding protein
MFGRIGQQVVKDARDTAVDEVQNLMWAANITEQENAWNEPARRVKANANPDVASFRAKMAPVYDSFANRPPPPGRGSSAACARR